MTLSNSPYRVISWTVDGSFRREEMRRPSVWGALELKNGKTYYYELKDHITYVGLKLSVFPTRRRIHLNSENQESVRDQLIDFLHREMRELGFAP